VLYVGPETLDGVLPINALLVGRSPMILGGVYTPWVFLGHESLTVSYVRPLGGTISYMSSNDGEHEVAISVQGGVVTHLANGATPDLYTLDIDDVAMRNIKLNGAEVKQWRHPTN
jgi:hypothetical protein